MTGPDRRAAARLGLGREAVAMLEALAAICLWGVSFVSIRIALAEISPVTLIVVRFALGALLVGAAAWRRGDLQRLRRQDLPALAQVGLIGVALQQLLQVSGQALVTASVAGFLAATAPAFTAALAALLLRERPRGRQWAGILLAAAGAALVATNGDWAGLRLGLFGSLGSWLVLASAVVWGLLTVQSRQAAANRPAALVTAGIFFFGALFTAPLFVVQQGWRELAGLSAGGWGAVLFTGAVCTAGAYLLNTHALKTLPAARVALIQNVEPLVVAAAASLVLGETLSLAMAAGGAAIVAGVVLAEWAAAPAAPPALPSAGKTLPAQED